MSLLQKFTVIKAFKDMGADHLELTKETFKVLSSESYALDWFKSIDCSKPPVHAEKVALPL